MGDDGDDGYKGKAAAAAGDTDAGTGGTEEVMNEFNFLQNPDGVDSVKADDKGRNRIYYSSSLLFLLFKNALDFVEEISPMYTHSFSSAIKHMPAPFCDKQKDESMI